MNIKLKKLSLKNFKGIKNLIIDFSKVTNIFGENATGKTTIFDAFTWLLFDKDSQDRTTFEIKTLDSSNEVIHGLEHEVTGILEVDGKNITLTKTFKEKWTKKRGEATAQLTGHETLYCIDEVPVKQSEYKAKVNSLIDENIFKLISNPLYFSNMKWQERRKVILDIIGDISPDRIINYKPSLKALEDLLSDKDIDTLKKSISARRKKLNDEIKSIPYRIDECNNSIKEVDFEALEFRKRGIQSGIKSTDEKLMDSSRVNEGLLKEKDRLYELKSKLKDIEYKTKNEARKPLDDLNEQFRDAQINLSMEKGKLTVEQSDIEQAQKSIEQKNALKAELKEKWYKENSKELEFDENEFVCPTCLRPFEVDDIEAKKEEMQGNFKEDKAKKLKDITAQGQTLNAEIEKLRNKIAESCLESFKENIAAEEKIAGDFKIKIADFKPDVNFENNQEYQELKNQIEELEVKFQQPAEVNNNIMDLKSRKRELEAELEDINRQLTHKERNSELKTRITQLMEEEKKLGQQIAELEGQEFLCEEFTKTKVELLENSINNKFKFVKFKLFNTLVNGAIEDCCEALVDGVPFSNANKASQYNAGLDIINALSDYYEVSAPIFIDNRESVNEILEVNSQVVNLIVSKDKALKIENFESEVA